MFCIDPSMDLERFQKPSMPLRAQTFGFQGYPNGFMEQYKPPVRAQASADVTRDVDRYFRRGKNSTSNVMGNIHFSTSFGVLTCFCQLCLFDAE